MSRVAWLLLISLAFAGCRKDSPSDIAALLPSAVVAQLPKELLSLAEVLPAETTAFGYVDLPVLSAQVPKGVVSDYRAMFDDLSAMTKRRWGLDVSTLRGLGVVVLDQQVVFLAALAVPPAASLAGLGDSVAIEAVGSLAAIGAPRAVAALSQAVRKQKPLRIAQPAWLKSALAHAVGRPVMFSVRVASAIQGLPVAATDKLVDLLSSTVAVGSDGMFAYLGCKPGQAGNVQILVATGITLMRQVLQAQGSALPQDGPGAIAAVLLRHYGEALFNSIKVATAGDEVSVALRWHAATKLVPTTVTPLSERVVAAGEWAVMQLDAGAPIIERMVAMTDVLEAPIDRSAVTGELIAAIGTALAAPGFDPRAISSSVGSDDVLVSIHARTAATAPVRWQIENRAAIAMPMPWGFAAVESAKEAALTAALQTAAPPLPLLATSKLATGPASFRLFVEIDRAPAKYTAQLGGLALRSVALRVLGAKIEADVVALPGQGPGIVQILDGVKSNLLAEVEPGYRDRAKAALAAEMQSIVAYHQAQMAAAFLTPTSVAGDALYFTRELPQLHSPLLGATAVIGVAAAVAIPAFTGYLKKSQSAPAQ